MNNSLQKEMLIAMGIFGAVTGSMVVLWEPVCLELTELCV